MEEEDDYDDFGDELENELASDGDLEEGDAGGPGLPTAAPEELEELSERSAGGDEEVDDADVQRGQEANARRSPDELDEEEERARQRQSIFQQMNEDQLNRFEAYRRSSLSKAGMRKLLQAVTGQNPSTVGSKNAVILLCGVAKMLVGELVEEARVIAAEQKESGPLRPEHIHAAYHQLDPMRKVLGDRKRRKL